MLTATVIFCLSLVLVAAMDLNPAAFFPNLNGNLTEISWAHAVNNKTYLESTLNSTTMMIEADIILGQLNGQGAIIPIMGHPPTNTSDLSLEDFLTTIDKFNKNASNVKNRKGVKLDFKNTEAFLKSVNILQELYNNMDYPIWINGDILKGPVNATHMPLDQNQFLQSSKAFNKSVLSIGWTTNYGYNSTSKVNTTEGSYNDTHIKDMLDVIKTNNVTQNITFPVRAGLAAESFKQMQHLVNNVENSTLTIWSSEGDYVNVTNLRTLIQKIGVDKVYVDVPESLKKDLHLDENSGGAKSIAFSLLFNIFLAIIGL